MLTEGQDEAKLRKAERPYRHNGEGPTEETAKYKANGFFKKHINNLHRLQSLATSYSSGA